ncbi:MAG: hypothetical protein IKP49_12205 [Treponema sp.]|nr:hypothetical protein [Treponema sp.]
MKRILGFFAVSFVAASLFVPFAPAQNRNSQSTFSTSASAANRRTAIRYLQSAKQYAADNAWKEADSTAKIGLEYDDTVADLHYISAVSQYHLGASKKEVLSIVVRALDNDKSQWVDYNKDNARILYADILCGILHFKEALAVLDSEPFVYSSDAEVIRVRSYYNLGFSSKNSDEALRKARSRVDTARKVYPEDIRFAELFYNFEYKINFLDKIDDSEKRGELNLDVERIADSFSSLIKSGKFYKNVGDDLRFLSVVFEKEGEDKIRMMKSFNAEKHSSIHFAEHALRTGILDETAALDYFYKFSDSSNSVPLNLSVLESFASALKEEKTKKEFSEYLNSYNGIIVDDTDGDLEVNLRIVYKRGRPEEIVFDKNQDGVDDWNAVCDFGVPQSVHLDENNLDIVYGNYPAVLTATYNVGNVPGSIVPENAELSFSLLADTLRWSPFNMENDVALKNSLGLEFFVPTIPEKVRSVSGSELLVSSSYYTMPTLERPNAFVQVSVLSGSPQSSRYCIGSPKDLASAKVYAIAQFDHGVPVLRLVDSDDDGLFETKERYGVTSDLSKRYITERDEMQIIANLFGAPSANTGFYVKMVMLDQNGDTVPEFVEEYTEGYGKISSWDENSDGKWDVRYVKHPMKDEDDVVCEDAMFHQPFTNEIVTVSTENGIPVRVSIGNQTRVKIFSGDSSKNFFWIGEKESPVLAKAAEYFIIKEFEKEGQGVSKIVQPSKNEERRYYVVKVGSSIFAELITETFVEKSEREKAAIKKAEEAKSVSKN